MNCKDLNEQDFKKHTFQFLHFCRSEFYFRKYSKYETIAIVKPLLGGPSAILKTFSSDAKVLAEVLEKHKDLKYNMKPYFAINEYVTFEEILNNWKLFFPILGLRFLGRISIIQNSKIKKIISGFYQIIKDLDE